MSIYVMMVQILKNLLLVLGLAMILLVALFFYTLRDWGRDKTYDRTSEWPQYYAATVSSYFKLPSELMLVKAEHTDTGIMGERFSIRFKLPATKTPERWLRIIARDSKLPASYHKQRFVYDCGSNCDLLRLEYSPAENLYQAQGGWD